jgi:hypothetical protein
MSRNAGTVAIRLDLRGQEELKRQLAELGPAGQRLSRDLEKAMKPVGQQGELVKRVMGEAGEAVDDLARQAGPLGSLFVGLNPVLLGVGAAVGGIALAVREVFVMMERSRETASWARGLETVSTVTGFATDRVLEFRTVFELLEEDVGAADNALEEFSKRLGEFRATGQGEARDGLQALGLSGLGRNELPVEQALDRVLERLADIEDPTRRLALADKLGLRDAAPLLQQSADEIERILGAAEDVNNTFSEGVLQRFSEAGAAIAEAQARADRARQLQALATLDTEVARQEAVADVEERKARILAGRIPLAERETELLENQIQHQEQLLQRLQDYVDDAPVVSVSVSEAMANIRSTEASLQQLNDELERRAMLAERAAEAEERMAMRAGMGAMWDNRLGRTPPDEDSEAAMSLERRRELEALLTQQLQSIQTPLERVAELEANLNAARAEYLRTGEEALRISEAEIAAILAHTRAQLGLNEVKAADKDQPDEAARQQAEALEALQQRVALEQAQARGDTDAVAALEARADLAERIRSYEEAGLKTAEARARAEADLAALAEARADAQASELDRLRESHELTIARLRGDESRVAMLEREAQIRADIERMTGQGLDRGTARDVAETRAAERDAAGRVGNFRSSVNDGFAAGFDSMRQNGGDFDDFVQGMGLSFAESALERLTTGLADAATDLLFDQAAAAIAGTAQGSAAAVPIGTAITGAGATAGLEMAGAITTAGGLVATQLAAAIAGGRAANAAATAASAAAGLPGLDTGGSILIGGVPGIDNNILKVNDRPVARVSADERIDIQPRLGGGARGGGVNQYFTFDARGAVVTQQLLDDFEARANRSAVQGAMTAIGVGEANAAQRSEEQRLVYR